MIFFYKVFSFSFGCVFFTLFLLWLCFWFLFSLGYFHLGVVVHVGVHIGVISFWHWCCPFHICLLFFHLCHLAFLTLFWCSSHTVLLFFAHWWWCFSHVGAIICLALVLAFFLHYCCGLCCVRATNFFMLVLHWYYNSFQAGDVACFMLVLYHIMLMLLFFCWFAILLMSLGTYWPNPYCCFFHVSAIILLALVLLLSCWCCYYYCFSC